jgi:hypothetical protein
MAVILQPWNEVSNIHSIPRGYHSVQTLKHANRETQRVRLRIVHGKVTVFALTALCRHSGRERAAWSVAIGTILWGSNQPRAK